LIAARDRDGERRHGGTQGRRVFEALGGPRQLLLVPGAGHNETLRAAETWTAIEAWLAAQAAGFGR
jgi:hypothetical protein